MLNKAFVLIAALVIQACSTAGPAGESVENREVTLQTLAKSQNCGLQYHQPFWAQVSDRQQLPVEFQSVDEQGPYWLAGIGSQPTGGYGLSINEAASIEQGELLVRVNWKTPEPGQLVTQAFTSPCVLVKADLNGVTSTRWHKANGDVVSVGLSDTAEPALKTSWQ